MAIGRSSRGVNHLRTLLHLGAAGGLTDAQLLERFAGPRDEAAELAFAVLVERHGPMVLRVCRGILRDPHAAQDAFQATFLVLVRRAGSIRRGDSLGSWLHGVACRVALAARSASMRRRKHERQGSVEENVLHGDPDQVELGTVLHHEIERLPARYRIPIVACYLEGLTHEQAAARLGWPLGTVRSRLARGRERLRVRLIHRGMAPSAALLAALLAPESASATVAPEVVSASVRAAFECLAGRSLRKGVLGMARLKLAAGILFPVVLVLGAALAGNGPRPRRQDAHEGPVPPARETDKHRREPLIIEVPARTAYDPDTLTKVRPRFDTLVQQVHVALGQRVKPGDPLADLYSTDLAQAKSDFQTRYVQWQHDRKLYDLREKLVQTGAISHQLWIDTQNDEQKSRLEYNLALDKLQIFEVTRDEIDALVEQLRDQGRAVDVLRLGNVPEKARMTLRAKTAGIVVERDVVPDNYYAMSSVLMVIASTDHLWVLAEAPEHYRASFRLGQSVEVVFPGLSANVRGTIEYVTSRLADSGESVRIRASISNPEGRLKSDMRVKLRVPAS